MTVSRKPNNIAKDTYLFNTLKLEKKNLTLNQCYIKFRQYIIT